MHLPASLNNKIWLWISGTPVVLLIASSLLVPSLMRTRPSPAEVKQDATLQQYVDSGVRRERMAAGLPVAASGASAPSIPSATIDRKLVRTGSLEAMVKSPAETAEQIRQLTVRLGGYLESLQINGQQGAQTATIVVRIPAARFDGAKQEIRKLADRVESERAEASDVTKQYVDLEAQLRNLRAEEAQYLQIMKSAKKVQDMLDVSEKLSGVRGEIEQQQAEFETLSRQVETVLFTASLRAEAVAPATENRWHPAYDMKVAMNDALDGLASYLNTMIAVLFQVPVILLWLATLGLVGLAGWKGFRCVERTYLGPKSADEKRAE